MLRCVGRPYICWKCITLESRAGLLAKPADRHQSLARATTESRRALASVSSKGAESFTGRESPGATPSLKHYRKSDIRSRLRAWDRENAAPAQYMFEVKVEDAMVNSLTRPQLGRITSEANQTLPDNPEWFPGDELADLRGQTSALVVGDLVEARFTGSRLPVLGVCLGRRHDSQYFYMNTGEVVPYRNLNTLFVLTNHFKVEELQPLIDILPDAPFPGPQQNVLHHIHTPEALESAAHLQEKLVEFYASTVNFYQTSLKYLDGAAELVSDEIVTLSLSLEQLAARVLPGFLKVDGLFPPHALYAVHLAVNYDSWSFRPLNTKWHRRNYIYQVRPKSDVRLLQAVEAKVRKLVDGAYLRPNPGQSQSLLAQNDLGRFILRARKAIRASRRKRQWTPHGRIGPGTEPIEELPQWEASDMEYIRFIELWSCHRIIPQASQVDSLGSTILRLTDMYSEGGEWAAHWTGFTFLQEIGWIPPWDIPARYDYRFPNTEVGRNGRLERAAVDLEASLRPDIANGAAGRKDWGDAPVFCVDSETTADVDDGFSLEVADQEAGEFWLHVHIADPASRIAPGTPLAEYIQNVPSSLYLAGFLEKMLPPSIEQEFSLNPGKPTLTFSAKVNEDGDIVDYRVVPGVIHKVYHMTQPEVSSVIDGSETTQSNGSSFSVGELPESKPAAVKKITKAGDLTERDRKDLNTMNRLVQALKGRRIRKGQLGSVGSRLPSPQVTFPSTTARSPEDHAAADPPISTDASVAYVGEPFIKFARQTRTTADGLVEGLMHTAGEVAAKYCQARNIPIPYSIQPEAVRNEEELRSFRRDVFDPLVTGKQDIPLNTYQRLFSLVGTTELSARPGPFYSIGVDAYTKASSPLRRFSDMLVHWQIHAALAEERSTGQSLKGTDCSEATFLPWTETTLSPLLPVLQARQRQARDVDNKDGPLQWMLQALLRAWRFGEAPLPKTFEFEVDAVTPHGVRGRLCDFHGLGAAIPLARLDIGSRLSSWTVGERVRVEIADVNTVLMKVEVVPAKTMKSKAGEVAFEGAAV